MVSGRGALSGTSRDAPLATPNRSRHTRQDGSKRLSRGLLIIWTLGSLLATAGLATLMWQPLAVETLPLDRTLFLPGSTTDGHYQIELDCEACHTEAFGGREVMQGACMECHAAELARVDNSHPRSKFTDPRNADRVALLDARECVACHQEHRPDITSTMGLSLPTDYCHRCHEDIGEERPTHRDLPFDGCANAGCHNFHDNRALYEDFLVDHRDEPDLRPTARIQWVDAPRTANAERRPALGAEDHDAPAELPDLDRWVDEWAGTSHALAGTQCSDCHRDTNGEWSEAVAVENCGACHEQEQEGFLASRHGMRLARALTPMRPALARAPMRAEAAEQRLDCNACHGAHDFDPQFAAAEACLGCHADDHSLAWENTGHADLWRAEISGGAPPGTGVSCATCHLPRGSNPKRRARAVVHHNQNDFLRPREKMVRSSCMECHGLRFSLDALADAALIKSNYDRPPQVSVDSLHFATVLRWQLEGKEPPWKDEVEDERERKRP